jgi:hypothetical protein
MAQNFFGRLYRDHPVYWSEGALFELRFLQIQAEKFSVYCYYGIEKYMVWKIIT